MKHMHKYTLLFSIAIACLVSKAALPVAEKKPWTFVVYMAAANDLNPFAYLDIEEMKKVGSNKNINIIVFATIQKEGRPKVTARLYIKKGKVSVFEEEPMDSGSRNTLFRAMQWAILDYPSDHLAVVLWDHGSGPLNRTPTWLRGICYDDETGNFLTDLDYKYVFDTVVRELRGGKKIDIVACDACLMANIEVAYALQSCADYFVSSQETIPGDGYDYSRVLAKFRRGSLSPEIFARAMVEAYDKTYKGEDDYTLSLLDLNSLSPLTQAVNELSDVLVDILERDRLGLVKKYIKLASSRYNCVHFSEETYIDLYEFARSLLKYLVLMPISYTEKDRLGQALVKVQRTCNACILENVHSSNLRTARGLSIYFPNILEGIEQSYPHVYWSRKTNWLQFLRAYLAIR